ncbi:MAG: helix-turn-helix domain-containing protein [Puniceicoccaceae bacterium]
MAGQLWDKSTINPKKMRILGRFALILVNHGRAFYEDSTGRNLDLEAGNAVLVTPTLAHAYGSRDGNKWGQTFVVFDGPLFELLQASEAFRNNQPVWKLAPLNLWQKRLEEILPPERAVNEVAALARVHQFGQLLVEMVLAGTDTGKSRENLWLEESQRLLGEQQEGRWMTPQEVARKVGLSYESFRKSFAAATGNPPAKFQQQRRIDLACAAIYRGQENFKQLAERLGFCDVYHFSKVFRQVTGTPPSAYRRVVRGS